MKQNLQRLFTYTHSLGGSNCTGLLERMDSNLIDILLVEDNAGDAELTLRALRKHNLANHVIHLRDGSEALDFLFGKGKFQGRNVGDLPKILLLDLKMPKVGGMEVLEKVKSDSRTKSMPVVILTSSAEDPDIERAYSLGANSYIIKPVDFYNFSKTVADLGFFWLAINKTKT
jgi:CheY-like chemotaxis protein